MRGTDGVEAVFLQNAYPPLLTLGIGGRAEDAAVVVDAAAAQQGLFAVNKQAFVRPLDFADAEGNLCPLADNEVQFTASGPGSFRACANGDPLCVEPFQGPSMHAFSGKLTAIVQSDAAQAGKIVLRASSPGLEEASLTIRTRF